MPTERVLFYFILFRLNLHLWSERSPTSLAHVLGIEHTPVNKHDGTFPIKDHIRANVTTKGPNVCKCPERKINNALSCICKKMSVEARLALGRHEARTREGGQLPWRVKSSSIYIYFGGHGHQWVLYSPPSPSRLVTASQATSPSPSPLSGTSSSALKWPRLPSADIFLQMHVGALSIFLPGHLPKFGPFVVTFALIWSLMWKLSSCLLTRI